MTPYDWWRDASCAPGNRDPWTSPDLWTEQPVGQAWGSGQQKLAMRICRQCPVRRFCLQEAMVREGDVSAKYRFGVWGGMTPLQRARLAGKAMAA